MSKDDLRNRWHLAEKFPDNCLIIPKKNPDLQKARNEGIQKSLPGKYILPWMQNDLSSNNWKCSWKF